MLKAVKVAQVQPFTPPRDNLSSKSLEKLPHLAAGHRSPLLWRLLIGHDYPTLLVMLMTSYCAAVYAAIGLGLVAQYEVNNRYEAPPPAMWGSPAGWDVYVEVDDADLQAFFVASFNRSKNPLEWWKHYVDFTSNRSIIEQPLPLPEGRCRIMLAHKWDFVNGVCNVNSTHARGLSYMIVGNTETMPNANNLGKMAAMVTGHKKTVSDNDNWDMVSAVIAGSSDARAKAFVHSWDPQQLAGRPDLVQIWGADDLQIDLCPQSPQPETLCGLAKEYYELNHFPFDPRSVPLITTRALGQLIAVPNIAPAAKYDRILSRMYYTDYAQLSGIQDQFSIGNVLIIDVRPMSDGKGNFVPMIQIFVYCALVLWTESRRRAHGRRVEAKPVCLFFVYGQLTTVSILTIQICYFSYREVYHTAINVEAFGTHRTVNSILIAQMLSLAVIIQVATPVFKRIGSPWRVVMYYSPFHVLAIVYSYFVLTFLFAVADQMEVLDHAGLYLYNDIVCQSKAHSCGLPTFSTIHLLIFWYLIAVMGLSFVLGCKHTRTSVLHGKPWMLMTPEQSATLSNPLFKDTPLFHCTNGLTRFETYCIGRSTTTIIRNVAVHKIKIDNVVYVSPTILYATGFQMIRQLGLVRTKDVYLVALAKYVPLFMLRMVSWSIPFFPVVGNHVYPGHRMMLSTVRQHNLALAMEPNPLIS